MCLDAAGGGIFPRLAAMDIGPELILNSGTNNIKDYHIFWANASNVDRLVALVAQYRAVGLHFDLEPQVGVPASTPADAQLFAGFLAKLRSRLAPRGVRVTAAVAQWSAMLKQFGVLSAATDRLLDMETYSANSMAGWLSGDAYGGDYQEFLAGCTPRSVCAPAIGAWDAACGKAPCWTSTEASGQPRIARMIADDIPEAAVFRLVQRPPASVMPQPWWWPLLAQFAKAPMAGAEA